MDYKKRRKELYFEDDEFNFNQNFNSPNQSDLQTKLLIDELLSQLSDELREVLELYYIHDLKAKEIALLLQIGLPLVKYRLRQAKQKLKLFLEKEDTYEY